MIAFCHSRLRSEAAGAGALCLSEGGGHSSGRDGEQQGLQGSHQPPQDFFVELRGRGDRVAERLERAQQLPRQVPRRHALQQVAHHGAPCSTRDGAEQP